MEVRNQVEQNAAYFNKNDDDLERALAQLFAEGPPQLVGDAIAPAVNEENAATAEEGVQALRMMDDEELADNVYLQSRSKNSYIESPLKSLYTAEARKDIIPTAEYRRQMRTLNEDQKEIVMYNRNWIKGNLNNLKDGNEFEGYNIFLSGQGGTGKSHVINLYYRDIIYFTRLTMTPKEIDENNNIALLTAYTGTAAFNISGMTLHSAFQINVRNMKAGISDKKLLVVQEKLGNLRLLIIDECSMVSSQFLTTIHKRLALIKKKDATDSI